MDSFSYKDSFRAAFASCFSCFSSSPSSNSTAHPPNITSSRANATASSDLERLLRDTDSDALSLHSNFGASPSRRGRRRRRPKFSLTLFGYTLCGRPPIYLADDGDDGADGRNRTASSWTLDSDAAPLDEAAIERLSSPDHRMAAQRASQLWKREEEERARRKAERQISKRERRARERAAAFHSLTDGTDAVFGDFEGGGSTSSPLPAEHVEAMYTDAGSNSGDADDADMGAEAYLRRSSGRNDARSGSISDSKPRVSASVSTGDASQTQGSLLFIPQTASHSPAEMQLPALPRKKPHRASRRSSILSASTASQSTSNTPRTPPVQVKHVLACPKESPGLHAKDDVLDHDDDSKDFPITGLSRGRDRGHFL